eukprot:gnl/Hemi2/11377_TR3937_c0_g1_i1.p1 gnl/Hemi2/11377_TR3937_c0_g1~~gnl/Hemi2/11377_TR3937_c0_g1_i1.p1  ORF type:complete len:280 (+),score=55.17 gnl/Hemi2/11377_TR3937_c0_g1_i1:44-883(+)
MAAVGQAMASAGSAVGVGGAGPVVDGKQIRVLYMHGFGSSPQGSKSRILRSLFDTACPSMATDLRQMQNFRQNRLLQCIVLVAVMCLLLDLLILRWAGTWLWGAVYAAVVTFVSWQVGWYLFRWMACQVVDRCVAIQLAAIQKHKPHVIVGSSWGAGIAVMCLLRGKLRDQSLLLLAPAAQLMAQRLGCVAFGAKGFEFPVSTPPPFVHIVQGTADTTVPLLHSQQLARSLETWPKSELEEGTKVKLTEIPGGEHKLSGIMTEEGLSALVVEAFRNSRV